MKQTKSSLFSKSSLPKSSPTTTISPSERRGETNSSPSTGTIDHRTELKQQNSKLTDVSHTTLGSRITSFAGTVTKSLGNISEGPFDVRRMIFTPLFLYFFFLSLIPLLSTFFFFFCRDGQDLKLLRL